MSNRFFNGLADDAPKEKELDTSQQLPQELQGKSPAEVYDLLKQEHSRVLEDETKNLKAKLHDYEANQQAQVSSQQPSSPTAPYTQQYQNETTPTYQYGYGAQQQDQGPDYWSDPEGFLDKQFERRVAPMAQMTFENMKEINKQNFRSRIGEAEWAKYGQEISNFVNGLSPQMQANPKAFETAYNMARSQHVDEIVQERATQESDNRLRRSLAALGYDEDQIEAAVAAANGEEPPKTAGNNVSRSLFQNDTGTVPSSQGPARVSAGPRKQQRKLNREQKAMAEKFGMTDEEYMEYSKLNTDVYSTLVEGTGNG